MSKITELNRGIEKSNEQCLKMLPQLFYILKKRLKFHLFRIDFLVYVVVYTGPIRIIMIHDSFCETDSCLIKNMMSSVKFPLI